MIACGHCNLSDFLPYLEVGNQDQIVVLQLMLQWVYPNGKSHCNKNPVGSVYSHKITDSQITPIKSTNISCDSTVLDTGIPKSDSTKMDLEVQNTTQNPMPKKVVETEAPKNDMVTVNFNTQDTKLNPKPNPMPKKTMTP